MFGHKAGRCFTTGCCNVVMGICAYGADHSADATGNNNVILGSKAGRTITSASNNILLGNEAGHCLDTGSNNIALGNCAGKCLGACFNNIVIGNEAACCATPNSAILAIGYRAGKGGSGKNVGFSNIFIGEESGCINVNGQQNTFLGIQAGRCNDGNSNTFIGKQAGQMSTSSNHTANTYIGCGAGKNQVDGKRNIAIGCGAFIPRSSDSDQIVFTGGYGTFNGPNDIYWFYGCCSGGCAHVGIGTTNPDDVVGAGLTSKLAVGILSAYQLYGDGSNSVSYTHLTLPTTPYV